MRDRQNERGRLESDREKEKQKEIGVNLEEK